MTLVVLKENSLPLGESFFWETFQFKQTTYTLLSFLYCILSILHFMN